MVSTLPSPDRNEKPLVAQPNILLVLAERLKEAPASALVKYGWVIRACNVEQDFATKNNPNDIKVNIRDLFEVIPDNVTEEDFLNNDENSSQE